LQFGREFEPAALDVRLDQRLSPAPRSACDRPAGLDLGLVLVDASHMMAEIGKAGAGNQSDIAGADHRDTHGVVMKLLVRVATP
jgi:hypothetical protein